MVLKIKHLYILAIIISLLMLWIANGCTPTPKPVKLDHFKVYKVRSVQFSASVLLQGQFDNHEVPAKLMALTYFANPTEKSHPGSKTTISNPDAHLNWYELWQSETEPLRRIRFSNQFGEHLVDIKTPKFLLVPAQKTSHDGSQFPIFLDHYKCYEIVTIHSIPDLPTVTLKDQFVDGEKTQVLKPRLFCVPVKKNLPGSNPTGKIVNEKDHLVIYEIPTRPFVKEINSKDQFKEQPLQIRQSEMLAVPSEKITVETPQLDHFKIYKAEGMQCNINVLLKGQFDDQEKAAKLTNLIYFANPTDKFHSQWKTAIIDSNAHLNWYTLIQRQPEPRRAIRFKNQFGQHSVEIKNPRGLLVPAQKTSHKGSQFPETLDHYKCYDITTINLLPQLPVVTLKDQFGVDENLQVMKPRFFCVPVSKNLPGTNPIGKIVNEKDHLVIYDITPRDYKKKFRTKDQFREQSLVATQSVMLAVPTEKQAVSTQEN